MTLDHLIHAKPGEVPLMALRRHPIVLLGQYFMVCVVAAVPLGAGFLLQGPLREWVLSEQGHVTVALVLSAYELIVWLFFITTFVDYYLDIWIVTKHRIVSVDQKDLFSRTVSELDLTKVQDVTSTVKGFWPSVLNYGHVSVQTAGAKEHFLFEEIHRPHEVRKRILDLVDAERQRQIQPIVDEMS